jgi:hypothetical protein
VAQEPFGLARAEPARAFNPVGVGDRSVVSEKAGGLGDERILALDVTPGILAPDEICIPGRQPGRARVAEHE